MFDIHCHLLPGIDDGPPDLESALMLARQAVDDGVTHAVLTPHVHPGRWENTLPGIQRAVDLFREALIEQGIPLFVGVGGEVRVGPEIKRLFTDHQLPVLGSWYGEKVILLELPHGHIPVGTDVIVSWLRSEGVVPLIAHPERNKEVMRSFDKLQQFVEAECLFQVTAGSLQGQFGENARRTALRLLDSGLVTVLASDAHHVARRPVNLSIGREVVAKLHGEAQADQLVYGNPLAIVRRQFLELGAI